MKTEYHPHWSFAALAAVLAAGAASVVHVSAASAQSAKLTSEAPAQAETTYTWSAELVSFDAASNSITVRAMFVSNPEKSDLSELHPGDSAMLTWSGLSTAAGIRALQRGSKSSFDRMTMPVDFVSSEHDGQFVVFKLPIPQKDAAAIAKLKAGDYVTASSPLRAKKAADAVISIWPYTQPPQSH